MGVRVLPTVGRDAERDAMWERLRRLGTGEAQVIVMRGPAGSGKSALVRWLAEAAAERGVAELVVVRGSDGYGLDDALRAWLLGGESDRRLARRRIERLLDGRLGFDDADADVVLQWLYPVGEPLPREARVVLAARILAVRASERPVLLVIDDADGAEDALSAAVRLIRAGVPAMVVAAARPDRLAQAPRAGAVLARLIGLTGSLSLDLDPLGADEHHAVLAAVLPLAPALIDELVDRTGGDPSVSVQVVRGWVAANALVPGVDGRYVRAPGVDPFIPADRAAVWRSRLDVHRAAIDVLGAGAALGLVIDAADLIAAVGDPVLTESAGSRFVQDEVWVRRSGGWAWAEEAARAAATELAREAGALDGVLQRVIAVLTARNAGPTRLGALLVAAGRREEAWPLLERAITEAVASADLVSHHAVLPFAWQCAGEDVGRKAFLLDAEVILNILRPGTGDRVVALADEQVDLAQQSGAPAAIARSLISRTGVRRSRGDVEGAVADGFEAVAFAEETGDLVLVSRGCRALGVTLMIAARYDEARAVLERSLTLDPAPRAQAWGLSYTGMLEANLGHAARAVPLLLRALELFEHLGLVEQASRTRTFLGDAERQRGCLDEAERQYRAALEQFWLAGDARATDARLYLALTWLRLGRLDAAIGGLEQARGELVAARRALIAPIAALFLAEAHARAGRFDVARAWYVEAGQVTNDLDVAQTLCGLAEVVRPVDPAWADEAKRAADAHFTALGIPPA